MNVCRLCMSPDQHMSCYARRLQQMSTDLTLVRALQAPTPIWPEVTQYMQEVQALHQPSLADGETTEAEDSEQPRKQVRQQRTHGKFCISC